MASAIVLARLLTPRDFGLVAMVSAATGLIAVFRDAGLSTATVVQATVTRAQVSTLFWINAGLGLLSALVIVALSPAIAWFFGDRELASVAVGLAGVSLLSGLTVQHQTTLQRELLFGRLGAAQVGSGLVGLAVGAAAALSGWRVWSLVAMSLAEAGALCGLVWLAAGWWPSLPARGSGVVPLIRFGGAVALRDLMAVVTLSADRFLLGRLFGPEEVGIYTRAHALLLRPLTQVIPPLQAVALPVFSRLQSDDDRYRSVVLRTLKLASFGSSFVAATILSTSDWLVVALLGDQWAESGVIFRFFAVAVFTAPVNAVLSWVLLTQHEGKELLRWGLMNDGLLIASIACAAPWGAEAVALSYSVSGLLIRTPLLYYVVSTCSPLRTSELAKATVPGAVLGSAAVALIATWRLAVGDISPWVGIAVSTVILLSYYSIVAGFTSWGRHAVIIAATLTKGVRASG